MNNMEDIELEELPSQINVDVHAPPADHPPAAHPIHRTRSMPELWDMEQLRPFYDVQFFYQILQYLDDDVEMENEIVQDEILQYDVQMEHEILQQLDVVIDMAGAIADDQDQAKSNEAIEFDDDKNFKLSCDSIQYVNEKVDDQKEASIELRTELESAPSLSNLPTEQQSDDKRHKSEDNQLQRTFNWVVGTFVSLFVLRLLYELS